MQAATVRKRKNQREKAQTQRGKSDETDEARKHGAARERFPRREPLAVPIDDGNPEQPFTGSLPAREPAFEEEMVKEKPDAESHP